MMPSINFLAVIVAALIPSIMGAIYYGPLLEKQWLDSLGSTKEDMEIKNPMMYGLAFLTAFIVALFMKFIIELVHKDVNEAGELYFASFHTFGHGAFHGLLLSSTLVVPVIISLGIFQKHSGKNILLNSIFWIICFALMGGILDVWN